MTTGVDEVEKGGGDRKEESLKKSFVGIHQNAIVPIRPLTSTSGGKFHVCKNILPALLLLRLFFFFQFSSFFSFSLKLVIEPLLFSIVYVCCLLITFLTASNWQAGDAQGNKPHTHVSLYNFCNWVGDKFLSQYANLLTLQKSNVAATTICRQTWSAHWIHQQHTPTMKRIWLADRPHTHKHKH